MAPRDRHGKTAQDYRESLITVLDLIAPRPRARRGHPLLWIWLLMPLATLWLNWHQVRGYLMPAPIIAGPLEKDLNTILDEQVQIKMIASNL